MSDSWLTYGAAAERLGVSAEAVRQLAIRHKWPRRRPNADPHGRVEIAVPADFEARPRPTVQHPSERLSDTRPSDELDILRGALERERERADQAENRTDAAVSRAHEADADRRAAIALAEQTVALLSDAIARADRAEAVTAGERQRADSLQIRLDGLLHDLDTAHQQAREAQVAAEAAQIGQAEAEADTAELRQAEAVRKGRGRLARLRAAWRGE